MRYWYPSRESKETVGQLQTLSCFQWNIAQYFAIESIEPFANLSQDVAPGRILEALHPLPAQYFLKRILRPRGATERTSFFDQQLTCPPRALHSVPQSALL